MSNKQEAILARSYTLADEIVVPKNNHALRTALSATNSAAEAKDTALMSSILTTAIKSSDYDPDVIDELMVYSHGLQERITAPNDPSYYGYTQEEIDAAKKFLETTAYGDFNEAMYELEHDLWDIDPTISYGEKHTNVFRPEFFTEEQRLVWEKFRKPVVEHEQNPSQDYTAAAEAAMHEVRQYQQRYYGPLQPVIIASYVKKDKENEQGFTARIINSEGVLEVVTPTESTKILNAYLKAQPPQPERPGEWHIPKEVYGYQRTNVEVAFLFPYEIYGL